MSFNQVNREGGAKGPGLQGGGGGGGGGGGAPGTGLHPPPPPPPLTTTLTFYKNDREWRSEKGRGGLSPNTTTTL